MRRSRSKRVSFNKEITVKEFIKKNSSNDDIMSPDLYHVPISRVDQDMDETAVSVDSNMELTFSSSGSPSPGEMTMMIARDTAGVECEDNTTTLDRGEMTGMVELKSESEGMGEATQMLLNDTAGFKSNNLWDLAKKNLMPSEFNNFLSSKSSVNTMPQNMSQNMSQYESLDGSMIVRRSARLARLSSEMTPQSTVKTIPVFQSPQINISQSFSKKKSSSTKQKKNVSLINTSRTVNESTAYTFSEISNINLIETSVNSSIDSDIGLKEAEAKLARRQKLIAIRDEKLKKLEESKNKYKQACDDYAQLEKELASARRETPHPFSIELMKLSGVLCGS